ncbi:hypothetical protein C8Q80DRAFT_1216306 [Daedaleopsis nitida]|nr:hypothetical protein C8Q80DRAFT_1216306 [Daedaleopsis nitida]
MPRTFQLTTIYEASLSSLDGHIVDLSHRGTAGAIRFVDCEQVHSNNVLRIYEIGDVFPPRSHPYATVSYFNAKGAESGEDISTHVLGYACAAALKEGVQLLWLDRLCIMQTNDEDKAWQIQQMHSVYERAALSLVLPAGISRLAALSEDTPWIHRAWTLQELLAPERSLVLFKWKYGSGTFHGATSGKITEVVPRKVGMADAVDVLQLCIGSKLRFSPSKGDLARCISVPVCIFGSVDDAGADGAQLWATMLALRVRGSEAAESAVWRSALMRTSSRPVDMIFSIMGLFGVQLPVKSFNKQDRVAATLALAKAVLEKRRPASWLGASYMSSFPTFPKSSVSGRATVVVHGEEREVSDWCLREAPRGRIDDDGYLVFTAPAAYAKLTDKKGDATPGVANLSARSSDDGKTYSIKDLDGRKWVVDKRRALSDTTKTMVVLVGVEGRLSSLTTHRFSDDTPVRAIAIKSHGEGKWHRVASFFLGEAFKREMNSWQTFSVAIGGPKALTESQLQVARKKEHKVRRKPIESN